MRRVLLAGLVMVLAGACASTPSPSPAPPSPSPSAPRASIAIDCGPVTEEADCLAIVAAAARRVPASGTLGVRAELIQGATPDVVEVTFIAASGNRASVWVIPDPMGGYTAVGSINGVTPAP